MKWFMKLLGLEPRQDGPALDEAPIQERRAEPDPEALKAAAKPTNHRPGLDLERLKSLPSSAYQPLTEYLSYIQVKRGETESLVFVRESDIDALAKMTGESRENFVKEFKRLGVLISMN